MKRLHRLPSYFKSWDQFDAYFQCLKKVRVGDKLTLFTDKFGQLLIYHPTTHFDTADQRTFEIIDIETYITIGTYRPWANFWPGRKADGTEFYGWNLVRGYSEYEFYPICSILKTKHPAP